MIIKLLLKVLSQNEKYISDPTPRRFLCNFLKKDG